MSSAYGIHDGGSLDTIPVVGGLYVMTESDEGMIGVGVAVVDSVNALVCID